MEHQQASSQQSMGTIVAQSQVPYANLPQTPPPPLQQGAMAAAAAAGAYPVPQGVATGQSPAVYQAAAAAQALSYQHLQQQHQQQLQAFWAGQMQEIDQVNDFKNHQLPLARIKKIMKADEDVRMISAEAPVLFAKACEMFILELTLRSWIHTEENKRRTLQKNDIAAAITRTDIFDFLVDIVPRDELKEEGLGMPRAALPVGTPADAIPYGSLYYMPQPQGPTGLQQPIGAPAVVVGRPPMHVDPNLYAQQQRAPTMPYMSHQPMQQMWQQPHMSNASTGVPPPSS
ncbi:hypothetical protein O6H91_11G009100 [Diphasiastrum complanatum]|uniref:Uncharacterized protein n=1 Tax=Diphasiastrum complanatum TaxID=34168 RepID=A0ACC2C6B7_DIPCM|nr:hypothetical protein O6H91_11G009100 [Diphasiastrum complanatum]